MNHLATALDHIVARLRAEGLTVRLGIPTGDEDLAVWPWQLLEPPHSRAAPSRDPLHPNSTDESSGLEVRFILASKDAPNAVANLTTAHASLVRTPVLQFSGKNYQLLAESLPPETLAALFSAAGTKLTLSSAYVLRSAGSSREQGVA
jgi:hypothetical protein